MPLTIGSGPITLVQAGTMQETVVNNASGPVSATLPVATTAGSTLIFIAANATIGGSATVTSAPVGWTKLISATETTNSDIEAWAFYSNPGGILSVTFQIAFIGGSSAWAAELSEWSGIVSTSAVEASGSATATSGTTLTPQTSGPSLTSTDAAISAWIQRVSGSTVNFTSPSGYTRLADDGSSNLTKHLDIEYRLNVPLGIQSPTLTSDTATLTTAVGFTIALKAAPPKTDQTAYIRNDSMQWKLNTGDFVLVQGGRYMLEDGSGFYQLEDGSGDYILDTYLPQLGDPVVWTGDGTRGNPSWNGRVVNVQTHDLDDVLTNYRLVDVAATNTSAAPGGSAPGDLSDVPTGGFYQLEDGSGNYLLEDGTGYYTLEGTSFGYRGLSVQKTQNQDGTVTTYGQATVFEGGFAAGQPFNLTSQNQGYSAQQFTIQNVTNSWVDQMPVYLLEFGDPYQTLQKAGGGVLTQVGSQATIQQGAAVPGGTLGYAQVTATQTNITTATDLTGLTVTVTVVSGRRVRISAQVGTHQDTNAAIHTLTIQEGATVLATTMQTIGAGVTDTSTALVILQPTAGVHTYKLTLASSAATGSVVASSTQPSWIQVEDIGV